MASAPNKRKSEDLPSGATSKKRKNWQTTKQLQRIKDGEIHIGDSGIWVTCVRGKENSCAAEVLDLFNDYASRLYQDAASVEVNEDDNSDDEVSDIEKAISSEIKDMKNSKSKSKSTDLLKVIRLDIECVLFVKTRKPIDPVELAYTICKDVDTGTATRNWRYAKRLTPVTDTGKAHENNYDELARKVLEPVFHSDDAGSKTFAIQWTSRNHNILTRNDVIKRTAALVGNRHKVDLKNPDFVILVDCFKSICTMAVVRGEYFALKRYNLSELGNSNREGIINNKASSRVAQGAGAPPSQPQIAERSTKEHED